MLGALLLPAALNVPLLTASSRHVTARGAVTMLGGFELPKLPKLELGGIQFEEGRETTTKSHSRNVDADHACH